MISIYLSFQVHESNWAQQFHTAKFKALSDQGATLQNIVYCAPCALHAHCMHTACALHTHCSRTAHAHTHTRMYRVPVTPALTRVRVCASTGAGRPFDWCLLARGDPLLRHDGAGARKQAPTLKP